MNCIFRKLSALFRRIRVDFHNGYNPPKYEYGYVKAYYGVKLAFCKPYGGNAVYDENMRRGKSQGKDEGQHYAQAKYIYLRQ